MSQTMKLKDIVTGQENCKVFGRLIRLWDAKYVTTNSLISIDGVILDEDGILAQISVPKNLEKDFRPQLAQGNVYIVSGLNAVRLKNKSHSYHHQPYILQFTSTTKVNHLESRGANIPRNAFDFCSFDEVPAKSIPSKPLLDLIGVISEVGPFDFAGPTSKKKNRKIQIRNLDEQTQQIVLWDQHGETFDEKTIFEKSQKGIVVGIFAGLTAGKFLGNYEASSGSATQIYIDLDLPEVAAYRTSYKWETPALQEKTTKAVQMSPLQAAGKLHTIEEISTLPMALFQGGKTYSCIAKVTSIIESKNWYYKACKKCKTGYNNLSDTPRCACPFPVQSAEYKLPLTITDNSSTMDAIAFYSVAEELVECSALEASQNMQIEPDYQPPVLNIAIGKTRLFNIGMSRDFSSRYTIKYVLKKSSKVDDHEKSILLSTTKESDGPKGISQTANHVQSLAAHQPDAFCETTPPVDTQTTIHVKENEIRSGARRSIDFKENDAGKSNRTIEENNSNGQGIISGENSKSQLPTSSKELDCNPMKKHKPGNADDNIDIHN